MTFVWTVTHYNRYLYIFLVTTFEQIWVPAFISNISNIIGYIFAGSLIYRFGIKISLFSSYLLTVIGGVAVLLIGLNN